MGQTYIAPNLTAAQMVPKIYSAKLFTESLGESFWIGRFATKDFIRYGDGTMLGTDPGKPLQLLRDLEKVSGDTIQYDLITDIKGDATYGDDVIKGKEAQLSFYTDQSHIGQVRRSVDAGGRMTRKRTKHDLRNVGKDVLKRYFARFYDEAITCYMAGTRGTGTAQWVLPTSWAGFAGNSLETPDTAHSFTIDGSGDISHTKTDATGFKLSWLDKLERYISTLDVPPNPVFVDGEPCYVLVLSPYAVEQLKADTAANSWLEIQKNAGVRGTDNPLFKDALGKYGRFILHRYSKIPLTTSGSDTFSHNLLLGAQAGVVAFGDAGGQFGMNWVEETDDRGNRLVITAGSILGVKKCRFNSTDFGAITVWSEH